MKQRNPRFGCPRIAQQINLAFGLDIDPSVVRRVLENRYEPTPGDNGPSWLTLLGHTKDSLWSIDFFHCESINLKSYWVLLVMDRDCSRQSFCISFVPGSHQFTRRIIGFSVHNEDLNGAVTCRMINSIISKQEHPKRISSDNDPLFQFHLWKANLRIRDTEEIKSIPYTSTSHPLHIHLSNSSLEPFAVNTWTIYFSGAHPISRRSLVFFRTITTKIECILLAMAIRLTEKKAKTLSLSNFGWKKYCRGLFEIPNLT